MPCHANAQLRWIMDSVENGREWWTYALPRPPGGAPVSPSAMTRGETEKALVEDSAGRASLVKDWRSIFANGSWRRKEVLVVLVAAGAGYHGLWLDILCFN